MYLLININDKWASAISHLYYLNKTRFHRVGHLRIRRPVFLASGQSKYARRQRRCAYRESIFYSHSSFLREEDWREFRHLPGAWSTSTFRFDHCTTPVALSNSAAPRVKFVSVAFASFPSVAKSRDEAVIVIDVIVPLLLPFHALTHPDAVLQGLNSGYFCDFVLRDDTTHRAALRVRVYMLVNWQFSHVNQVHFASVAYLRDRAPPKDCTRRKTGRVCTFFFVSVCQSFNRILVLVSTDAASNLLFCIALICDKDECNCLSVCIKNSYLIRNDTLRIQKRILNLGHL